MINNVNIEAQKIKAGENIVLLVDAVYPIVIEVYCFVIQPPPPKFEPCPDSGRHVLQEKIAFIFRTDVQAFQNDGYVEFKISDSEEDVRFFQVEIVGFLSSIKASQSNVSEIYQESVKKLEEIYVMAKVSSEKYKREVNFRKYAAYFLKFNSLIFLILIGTNYLSYGFAIPIVIINAIEMILSPSRRLLSITYAVNAYRAIGEKVATIHQFEQSRILINESNQDEAIKKIMLLNSRLTFEARTNFSKIENAITTSDIGILQSLAANESILDPELKKNDY